MKNSLLMSEEFVGGTAGWMFRSIEITDKNGSITGAPASFIRTTSVNVRPIFHGWFPANLTKLIILNDKYDCLDVPRDGSRLI